MIERYKSVTEYQRCVMHPDQRLIKTHDANPLAKSIFTCPICNAEYFDGLTQRPDVITIKVGPRK